MGCFEASSRSGFGSEPIQPSTLHGKRKRAGFRRRRGQPSRRGARVELLEDRVLLANGYPDLLASAPVSGGLIGNYYNGYTPTGYVFTRVDPTVNLSLNGTAPGAGLGANFYTIVWDGYVAPTTTGTYTFTLAHDDGAKLFVNNQELISAYSSVTTHAASISLVAGQLYPIHIDFHQYNQGATASLSWSGPGVPQQIIPSTQLFHDPVASTDTIAGSVTTGVEGVGISLAGPTPGLTNPSWSVTGPGGAAYGTGSGIEFDGQSSNITIPDGPSLDPANEMTLTGSFRANALSGLGYQIIYFKGNAENPAKNFENRQFLLWVYQDGSIGTESTPNDRIGIGRFGTSTGPGVIVPGRWYRYAVVINSDYIDPSSHQPAPYMAIYVNGSLVSQTAYDTSGIRTTPGPLQFGQITAGGGYFDGEMASTQFYNVALTAAQIQGGQALPTPVSSWNFQEPVTSQAVLDSVGSNNGTLNSALRIQSTVQPSSSPNGSVFNFVPNRPGSYTVTLNALQGGSPITAQQNITVTAVNPSVSILAPFGGPQGQPAGTNLTLNSLVSDPNPNATETYSWTVSLASVVVATGSGSSVTFRPMTPGSYSASLTVNSSDGGSTTAVQPFSVYDVPPTINLISASPPSPGGLLGTYYDNYDFTNPVVSRVDSTVNFNWGAGSPDPNIAPNTFSVTWDGFVKPTVTGVITFGIAHDDGATVSVNGVRIIDSIADTAPITSSGSISLVAGRLYPIHIEYRQNGGGAVAQLLWAGPGLGSQIIPASQLYAPPPQARTLSATVGSPFSAFGAFAAPGNATFTGTVNYGDGTAPQPLAISGLTFTLNHTYAFAGNYLVSITLVDSNGGTTTQSLPASVAGFPGAVLANGPIAYYRLGENLGTTATDSSGNGNTARVLGGVTPGQPGPLSSPVADLAYQFSGGRVALSAPSVNTTAGQFNTVSFWMKWDGIDDTIVFGFPGYGLWFQNGSFGFNTGQSDLWGISSAGLANTWVHVTAELSNGNAQNNRLFINGVQQTLSQRFGTTGAVSANAATTLQIGGYPGDQIEGFSGLISEFALFNTALSSGQVSSLYAASASNYPSAVLADSPIGYWRLQETTGTVAADSTANNHPGAITKLVTQGQPGALADGTDSAYQFNGGRVQLTLPTINTTPGQYNTISFWMNWDGTNGEIPFGFSGNYGLWIQNGSFGFNTGHSDLWGISSAGLANTWVYVTAQFANGNAQTSVLYINGTKQKLSQKIGSTPTTGALASSVAQIGGYVGDYTEGFTGKIGEFAVYNTALSDTQLANLFDSAVPGNFSGAVFNANPVAYYPLGETSGSTVTEISGSGNNATITSQVILGASGPPIGSPSAAYQFNGILNHGGTVQLSLPAINTAAGTYNTVAFWMKWDGTQNIMPFGFTLYDLWFSGGRFGFNTAAGDLLGTASSSLANQWVHVVAEFYNGDVTQSKLFINGVQQSLTQSATPSQTTAFATPNAQISGWRQDNFYRFSGALSEFAIYKQALSSGQVTALYNAASTGTYPSAVLANNPIGYWRLNDTSGASAADSSGNNHPGTIVFNPVVQGQAGPLPNGSDKAYQFNGAAVPVTIPAINTTAGANNTVAFWMKWDGGNSQMPFGFQFYDLWFSNGFFGFNSFNSDIWGISSAGLANRWVHVVAVFNNGNVQLSQLFINGVQQTLAQQQSSPANANATAAVTGQISGCTGNAAFRFTGGLSEFAFYNKALTASQVAALYAAANPGGYAGAVDSLAPVGYWRLGETSGTTAIDQSGNANNGNVVGQVVRGVPGPLANGSDSAYQFTGGTIQVSIPGINTVAGAYNTVSFWMNWDGTQNVLPFTFNTGYDIWIVNGTIGFNTYNNDMWGTELNAGLANKWVYVTAEFYNGDARNSRLFFNGVEQ